MKKTRRFVALLLAAVLALALFTACGAAEQPQSAIGKVYEDWFVEQINSKRPGKPVQKVDVKHSEMRTALAKISEDGKFKARDGGDHEANGYGFGESWYWMILSDPIALNVSGESTVEAVKLTPENLTQYGLLTLLIKSSCPGSMSMILSPVLWMTRPTLRCIST